MSFVPTPPGVALMWAWLLVGCAPAPADADHDGLSPPDDCDDRDPRVGPGPEWYGDADGDGYPDPSRVVRACIAPEGFVGPEGACPAPPRGPHTCPSDCRDGDASIHPGAAERCDGLDQDCDGAADDDATDAPIWYEDADSDGHVGTFVSRECEAPVDGAATEPTDCDDADASAFPGGPETCDYADDDCDGVVDEGLPVATWWRDGDRDGFGDPALPLVTCGEPLGYADNADDCDDADRAEFPGAIWHPDGDGDGYGDPGSYVVRCERPAAHVSDATDCDDADRDEHPGAIWAPDADGDGYGSPSGAVRSCARPEPAWMVDQSDCDDARADVRPGGTETCNRRDDDCDGVWDDDAIGWYDADGDGYGDPATECVDYCATGWVGVGDDCDDAEDDAFPGATEWCNGRDDDCDGLVDDDDPDEAGDATWYADADRDTFGDDTAALTSCAAPAGYADDGGDCDVADASVSPGAAEICFDEVDDDCDGSLRCPAGAPILTGQRRTGEGDALPSADLAALGDVDADGDADVLLGTPRVGTLTKSGAAWYVPGPLVGERPLREGAIAISGGAGTYAGTAVSRAGDLDGDGVTDLAVGGPGITYGPGDVWLLSVPSAATDTSAAFASIVGTPLKGTGEAVSAAGDVDGDGADDLLVGLPGYDTSGKRLGAVSVIFGPVAGSVSFDSGAMLVGIDRSEQLGGNLLGGHDFDGDGVPDVAATGGEGVVVHSGADLDMPKATRVRDGTSLWDVGTVDHPAPLAAGDLDGDGLDDLVIGNPSDYTGSEVWIATEPFAGGSTPPHVLLPEPDGWLLGSDVAVLPDTDGVGRSALLVSDPRADSYGAIYLLREAASGTVEVASADQIWRGTPSISMIGTRLLSAGDVDGDGTPDALYAGTIDGDAWAGALFLISGSDL
jgi:hypothetical protein